MKKILIAEAAVLVLLVVAALFIRVGITDSQQNPGESTEGSQNTIEVMNPGTQSSDSTQTSETDPPPTETDPPEPTLPWFGIPENLELSSRHCFIYDSTTGTLEMLTGNADDRIYPASVTKLMTALVVLKYMEPNTKVTAGDELDFVAWDASVAGLTKGDRQTVETLIAGMLLPSGNDAAYVLAAATGRVLAENPNMPAREAVNTFMDKVNEEAKAMGLTGTHFVVPDGYHDPEHYTTPRDLVTIGAKCLENQLILKYTAMPSMPITLQDGTNRVWRNSNLITRPDSEYYCADVIGLKTGYTSDAGRCLLAAFDRGETMVIIGVFGAEERETSFREAVLIHKICR